MRRTVVFDNNTRKIVNPMVYNIKSYTLLNIEQYNFVGKDL